MDDSNVKYKTHTFFWISTFLSTISYLQQILKTHFHFCITKYFKTSTSNLKHREYLLHCSTPNLKIWDALMTWFWKKLQHLCLLKMPKYFSEWSPPQIWRETEFNKSKDRTKNKKLWMCIRKENLRVRINMRKRKKVIFFFHLFSPFLKSWELIRSWHFSLKFWKVFDQLN